VGEAEIVIWEDDLPSDIMGRLTTVLIEIGIQVQVVDIDREGYIENKTYRFMPADPLDCTL
jgi:hypothetical protein